LGDYDVEVIVPARPTANSVSWTSTDNVTIRAGYDAIPPSIPALDPAEEQEITLKRPAYTLSVSNISPNPLPSNAGTVDVTFASTADSYYVQWRNSASPSTSTVIGTAQILVTGTGTQAVAYPALTTLADRSLYLYHATTGKLLYSTPVVQKKPYYMYVEVHIAMNGSPAWYCPSGYTAMTEQAEYPIGLDIRDIGHYMVTSGASGVGTWNNRTDSRIPYATGVKQGSPYNNEVYCWCWISIDGFINYYGDYKEWLSGTYHGFGGLCKRND
jgi:hypothetical protein